MIIFVAPLLMFHTFPHVFHIVVTYEIQVFFEGAKKEVFSSIFKKHYKNTKA
jgi:hypothetical protein